MFKRCLVWIEVLCFVCLLLFGNLSVNTKAATTAQIQSQIDELKRQETKILEEMKDLELQISEHDREIEGMIANKDIIDQQIMLLQEQIDISNEQMAAYRLQIAEKQTQLDDAEAKRTQLHAKHKQRIRAMEEQGTAGYWSVIFRAKSFSDFLDQISMMQEISRSDNKRLAQLREIEIEITDVKAELLEHQTELESAHQQLLNAEEELLKKREEADIILQDLLAKGEEYALLLAESEQKQEELMEQLAQKESEFEETAKENEQKPDAPDSGQWIVPVPYYTLTSPFGMRFHPVLGIYRMHNGVDMACAQDTPIYASRSGVVTATDYQEYGAGNYVQIDHGDGYRSIYMHMIRYVVSPGQKVSAGDVIGFVGSTGLSDGNHLHFGISYNGTYVNPMEYLP